MAQFKQTIVKFDTALAKKSIYEYIVQLQTKKLEEYAQEELDAMIANHTFNNDTYNTENSYVWCLYLNGGLVSFGFNVNPQRQFKEAKFHKQNINGRHEAEAFVRRYKPNNTNGWEVVWAATTPYTTYLESGANGRTFLVVSSQYDSIRDTFGDKGTVEFKIEY